MKTQHFILTFCAAVAGIQAACQGGKYSNIKEKVIQIETSEGVITLKLYDQTPLHRDNFLRLIADSAYDGVIFHRVINGFMVQAGDLNSKNPQPGVRYGASGSQTTIPAEFNPALFHKKGALAAARTGDAVNPERRSSETQFYIVQGKTATEAELAQIEAYISQQMQQPFAYSQEQKQAYATLGGTPFLDMQYTVFGEVIEGLEIVDKIAAAPTLPGDRPQADIIIRSVRLLN